MKKSLLLFATLLFFTQLTFSQTEVSGGIFSETSWTSSASPYIVTDDIVIFPDASLTIEPGVEVRFEADTHLELREGNLFAEGTDTAPIIFTLNDENPENAPKWDGIENTAPASTSTEIVLDHVIIEYAKTGLNYGEGFAYRYIDHSIFRYNDRGVFDGAQGYNWVTISNTEFLENGVGMEGRMSAINCTFNNNDIGFGNPMTFNDISEGARVTNCTFSNNGLAVGFISNIITIAVIENSEFFDNEQGFYGYWAIIDSSFFSGSTDKAIGLTKGDIQNSTFANSAVGIQVNEFNTDLSIQNNSIDGNNIGLQIDGPGALIQNNIICNNLDQAAVLTTAQAVDLSNNCWCTTDPTSIPNLITDAYDDVSLGILTYAPINTTCISGLVFPGDADNNGFTNNSDLLQIGLAYNYEGSPRIDASLDWFGQQSEDWSFEINNSNAKHADCNGDGIVDENDISAININYNNTHANPITYQPNTNTDNSYSIALELPDTLVIGEELSVDILIADPSQPIEDIYGIAFAIEASESFFEPSTFLLNTSDSWLGNMDNLLQVSQEFPEANRIELAIVKNNQQPSSGSGKIASFSFVISEDIIVSILDPNRNDQLTFSVKDIQTISSEGINLVVENDPVTVAVLNPQSTNTQDHLKEVDDRIHTYPNPVKDILLVHADGLNVQSIRLLNMMGQSLQIWEEEGIYEISTQGFQSGLYLLEVQTDEGIGLKKIMIE